MKKIKKTVRLSVTLLLIVSMLLMPMSPIFAVTNEKEDDADLVADSATVESEKNVPVLIDEEKMIYFVPGDTKSRDRLYSAPDDVLAGTTSELFEYFLESRILTLQALPLSSTGEMDKVDFTLNIAFKELVSREDFVQILEKYAKDVLNGTRTDAFAERKLEKIVEQDSVKNTFFATDDSSLNYPVIASLYSEDSD